MEPAVSAVRLAFGVEVLGFDDHMRHRPDLDRLRLLAVGQLDIRAEENARHRPPIAARPVLRSNDPSQA